VEEPKKIGRRTTSDYRVARDCAIVRSNGATADIRSHNCASGVVDSNAIAEPVDKCGPERYGFDNTNADYSAG